MNGSEGNAQNNTGAVQSGPESVEHDRYCPSCLKHANRIVELEAGRDMVLVRELHELREAAGVDETYEHGDLVVLVRNAVPQIARALELGREVVGLKAERDGLHGEVAAMRKALDAARTRLL